ncbi:MAG: polyamine aminopropyltransferase [Gammaproteobacteria bacterium]|nr:polyamine aminopropyltransferase [Gammaproteobacteria bacterium]MCF6361936.1 polyamine aminopropyltransferase [Gammaproteobacteria bacterium]
MSTLDANWFTEIHQDAGSAFSLRIRRKLADEQTPYQHIEVFETTDFGNFMVIDGCTMVSARENFIYHEMMTHPVLYTHAAPRNVVIIGGGDCGTLREVLRHPEVESVVQVEIDERVTRLAEQYFPELCELNDDPRATLIFGDGIQWVKDAAGESLDVVIIDSTDPIGPAEGLFSRSFYEDCLRVLRPGGMIVQQSESPLLHLHILRDMHSAMCGAGYADVKTLQFPQMIYPSGWWSATIARKGEKIEGLREADVAAKPFETKYYTAEIHWAAFVLPMFLRQVVV